MEQHTSVIFFIPFKLTGPLMLPLSGFPLTAVTPCNSDRQQGAEERTDRWSSVCPTVYMLLPAQREDRCSECVSLQTPSGPQAGERCSRQAEQISRRLEPSLIRPSVRANRQQHPPITKHNQPTQNLHPSLNTTNQPKICICHYTQPTQICILH